MSAASREGAVETPGEHYTGQSESDPLIKKESVQTGKKESVQTGRPGSVARILFRGAGVGICIVLMIACWSILGEKLQDLDKNYHQNFFQAYWLHSSYALLYVLWKIWLIFPGNFSCNRAGEGTLTNFRTLAWTSGLLAFLLYVGSYTWYLSIRHTSISANTAVCQSMSVLVFILSIPLLKERVTMVKILSVAITVAGVVLIAFFDSHDTSSGARNSTELEETLQVNAGSGAVKGTPLGYVILGVTLLISAIQYIFYKKLATHADDPVPVWNGVRVTGYIGVHTLLAYWPVIIVVHFMGVEPFHLPTLEQLSLLMPLSLLAVIFRGAYFVAIALSSPLIVSVGSVLVLPTTVLADWILKGYILPWQAFLGIGGILFGFFMLVLSEYWHVRRENRSSVNTTLVIQGDQVLRSALHSSINISQTDVTMATPSKKRLKSILCKYII